MSCCTVAATNTITTARMSLPVARLRTQRQKMSNCWFILEIEGAHNQTHSMQYAVFIPLRLRAKRESLHRVALALALAVNWNPDVI